MNKRLIIYLLLAVAAVMAVRTAQQVQWDNLDQHAIRADYIGIRLCITMANQGYGNAAQLYDLATEQQVEAQIMGPIHFVDGILPCDYPPYTVLLASPLYNLSAGASFVVWDVIQVGALLLSLWLLRVMLPPQYRYLLWLGAIAFLPLYHSLIEGQTSPSLLLGVVLLWRGLRAGGQASWWAGAALGLCLLKPQFIPLFLLYLLFRRDWRAVGGFAAVSLVAYLLAAAQSGFGWPGPYLNLVGFFAGQSGHYGFYPTAMFNWRGLLTRLGLDNAILLLLISGVTVVALIYAWWVSERATMAISPIDKVTDKGETLVADEAADNQERVGTLELQLAATAIAAALTNFHLYDHDLIVLLFSGAVLLGWAAQQGWPRWLGALLLAGPFASLFSLLGLTFDTVLVLVMLAAFGVLLYLLLQPRLAITQRGPNLHSA